MSAMLTLLFVCQDGHVVSPFLAPLRAAGFSLLVGHRAEDSVRLLSNGAVDAILIQQDHLPESDGVVAELKRVSPRTPVVLLRGRKHCKTGKPHGIAAVCCADPGDEYLLNALPTFFRFILGKQAQNAASGAKEKGQILGVNGNLRLTA